ncbi:hypothetical protein AC1031_014362 [Aphanomyces cochlioides]|nr:hypothetical protein AC1031_014362 [Aphanomyces cochlioides]
MENKKAIAIAIVEKHLKASRFPGIALSVVVQNETILSRGFGTTELDDPKRVVTSDTIFPVERLTEVFIALAIAKLFESRQVSYSDRVKTHLPSFTLQDKTQSSRTLTTFLLNLVRSLQFIQALAHLSTHWDFRPGNLISTFNYILLGQVIEAITKKSWFQYVKEVVPDHLGMNNTFGRPADVPNKDQLTSGHITCNQKAIGPFSYLNSTMVESSPSNNYAATFSMVSSIDDMTKLSQALLHHDRRLFETPKIFQDMLTGHNIYSELRRSVEVYGFRNISESTPVDTGFGFDIIGNLVDNQPYFGKLGGFNSVAGWLPTQQVGVVLLVNGFSIYGHMSDNYRILAMRIYLLKFFMDVPVETLDRDYQDWMAWINTLQPEFPCSSHYFDGTPWDKPGMEIPESTMKALVGTYCAVKSQGFKGNVTVARDGRDLTLQYGAYTRRLIATEFLSGV